MVLHGVHAGHSRGDTPWSQSSRSFDLAGAFTDEMTCLQNETHIVVAGRYNRQ